MTIIDIINKKLLDRDLKFLALFGNRKGKDKPFQDWLKLQPCKNCGEIPHYEMSTFIYNMPCHVRRVNRKSGTAYKPPYNATTMCFHCHSLEHGKGQSSVASSETLDLWADESLSLFVLTCLRANLGFDWKLKLPWWLEENGIDIL